MLMLEQKIIKIIRLFVRDSMMTGVLAPSLDEKEEPKIFLTPLPNMPTVAKTLIRTLIVQLPLKSFKEAYQFDNMDDILKFSASNLDLSTSFKKPNEPVSL